MFFEKYIYIYNLISNIYLVNNLFYKINLIIYLQK